MSIDSKSLEKLSRDALIAKAAMLGAKRPELLTRPELRDEIIRLTASDDDEKRRARGWFGVARDLVASVVGQGLHLPDTADLIRGVHLTVPKAGPPVATVTLAEIYAAQGHVSKALDLLDEVIAKEPDHAAAQLARARWSKIAGGGAANPGAPGSESLADPDEPADLPADLADPNQEQASEVPVSSPIPPVEGLLAEQQPEPAVLEALPESAAESEPEFAAEFAAEEKHAAEELPGKQQPEPAVLEALGDALPEPVPELVEEVATEPVSEIQCPVEELPGEQQPEPAAATVVGAPDVSPEAPFAEDRLLLVRTDEGALYCHWQVTTSTLTQMTHLEPNGHLALRIVDLAPSWDGPTTSERSIPIDGPTGYTRLDQVDANRVLRAALGWHFNEAFTVLAIAAEFDWNAQSGSTLCWAPPLTASDEIWPRIRVSELIPQLTAPR